ncbi:MAG TPA: UbiA-like polyprenyltransferase, partial [Thermoanaerobaculia bacterium]|nr:UbiA-like polyprenyltransferase [Thermoanaerobaculia bacterium]
MSSFLRSLRTVLEMIKFEHTLFALPFAFLGMVLAARGWPSWPTVLWIVVAMIGARSAAMGFNRLVDRKIDAANPRTAARAIPAGLVSPRWVALFVGASSAVLVLAAWELNPLAFYLSPVALGILFLYSYTKRFTWASHLVLGLSLAGAPLGAWIAVRGDVTATPVLLAVCVLLWVAG